MELALAAAAAAVELTGGRNWESLQTLARAWATKGDFVKAVEFQERAVEAVEHPSLREVLDEYRSKARR